MVNVAGASTTPRGATWRPPAPRFVQYPPRERGSTIPNAKRRYEVEGRFVHVDESPTPDLMGALKASLEQRIAETRQARLGRQPDYQLASDAR